MAAKIQAEFGIASELIGGGGGIFEVSINGTVVYPNRTSSSRFPEDEEIFREIRNYR